MHPDDIVRLTTAENSQEAALLQQALQAEGIQSRVVGDYLDAGIGDISTIRPEVWVHRDDLERARTILESHDPPPAVPPEANPEPEEDE